MQTYIDIHTHTSSHKSAIIEVVQLDINASLPQLGSVGIHPWDAEINKTTIDEIEEFLVKNTHVWIGEIGIDRVKDVNLEKQKNLFICQLKLAQKYSRPAIIHNVKASSDILQLIKQEEIRVPLIFHASNISIQQVNQLLEYNCYFSFGKNQLLSPKNMGVFKMIPQNKIFFETDTAETSIEHVYQLGVGILEKPLENVQLQILNNYKEVLKVFKNNPV